MKTIKRVYNLSTPERRQQQDEKKERKKKTTTYTHTPYKVNVKTKCTLNPVMPSPVVCPREVLSIKPNLPTRACFSNLQSHSIWFYITCLPSHRGPRYHRSSGRYVFRTSHFCLKLSTRSSQSNRQIYYD